MKSLALTSTDLGAVRNVLGFFSPPDFQKINPKALMEATGYSGTALAQELAVNRTRVYRETVSVSPAVQKAVFDLMIATDIAHSLVGGNTEETKKWLVTPNLAFFGDTPFRICLRGDGQTLIDWLKQRAGLVAGAAY